MRRQLTIIFALAGLAFGSHPLSAQQVAREYGEEIPARNVQLLRKLGPAEVAKRGGRVQDRSSS